VAHASSFHFLPKSNPVGAPSFALFAKGGMHNCSLTALAFVGRSGARGRVRELLPFHDETVKGWGT